ncbi:Protein SOSEKI 1 [Pseudogymnoascus australis]
METPDGNGQEQGSDMVTDHTSSDTKKAAAGVKTSNSTSQNPELPREGHGNRKPGTMIWESHYGVSRYGLGDPLTAAGTSIQEGKVKEEGRPAPVKTYIIQNEASDSNTRQPPSCSTNGEKSPGTTTPSVPEESKAANESGDTPLEPPVTKEVLAELEIAMVISNPKFRHDFNFGCNIPYAPKKTKQKSDEFWRVLRLQISELWSDREAFIAKHPGNAWTLPILLRAIGEILAALLPQRDSSVINETLDVDLLMQQLTRGRLNLKEIADWISGTLRKHCAPMRDCDVFKMAEKLTAGFHSCDVGNLVDGLMILLTTIEAMRLDVTNHQINHLTLIQSFVSFQQTKILRIISTGNIDIYGTYAWFDSYQIPDEITALSREGGSGNSSEQLDSERIADLRMKLLNAVNMNICMNTFKQIDKKFNPPKTPTGETLPRVKPGLDTIERNRRFGHVYSALRAIVHDYSNPDFDTSSPPTSSLLNFDPWKVATPALALEILRNANAPLSDPYCEKNLTAALSNPSSEYFGWSERPVFERLGVLVEKHVDAWQSLDSVALYKVAPDTGKWPTKVKSTTVMMDIPAASSTVDNGEYPYKSGEGSVTATIPTTVWF